MPPVRRAAAPLALCVLAAGCAAAPAPDTADRAVRTAVAAWSRQPSARPPGLPLAQWTYEVTGVRREGARATATAELRYRIDGYDTAPAGSARDIRLSLSGGRWTVTGDAPAPGTPPQPWDQGPLDVVRGARALVLRAGRGGPDPADVAADADRAVPAVAAAWPRPWAGRVVVLVPPTQEAMAALLGRPAAAYTGMAAVTTGSTGGAPAPADRIVLNPAAYAQLSAAGRNVVLTHEATHAATRPATTDRTPLWLSEGLADWAAYRGTGTAPADAAPALARAVRRGELPAGLPADRDFAFGTDADSLARAYEGAWLACRLIADRWGDGILIRLYERAGREPLDTVLREELGLDGAALARAWRERLRAELAAAP
ncbi:hypothetical protein SUDANB120_01796 [Streptomyces sp. enrichment culture]|uniref:hypothetical protein n=1 Tax=Streptomyces sp. enrichment culture TaxID=1795815 RepID=UPI003F54E29A